jgi:glycosyltransferase involved in cell wall biosynthesis
MRITLVTETYPPEVNGVATTLGRLTEGLADRGHELTIIRPRQGDADQAQPKTNPAHQPVAGLPLPRYEGLRFGLPAGRTLSRRWRQSPPDVVHIATEGPLGFSAMRLARQLKIPVSSSFHTNFHEYGKHYGYGLLQNAVMAYLRAFHNRAGCTLVPSADRQELLEEAGFQRVGILGRGVDAGLFSPDKRDAGFRASWGIGSGQWLVSYVGRVAEEKNVPLVIRAFRAMQQHQPDAQLMIVGDGPVKAKLQKAHPDVLFTGMRTGEPLANAYAASDVFLFPSLTETYGNVVAEAMASGVAVLAFDYAAARALIEDQQNGRTVPFGDEAAFIRAAKALARDPAATRRLGDAARVTALGYSWQSIIQQFESWLKHVQTTGPVPAAMQPTS